MPLLLHEDILVLARWNIDDAHLRLVLGVADSGHDGRAVSEDDVNLLQRSSHGLWVEEEDRDWDTHANACKDNVVLVATARCISKLLELVWFCGETYMLVIATGVTMATTKFHSQ